MGSAMEPHVRGLLDIMFSAGLSTTLVDALEQITARWGIFVLLLDVIGNYFIKILTLMPLLLFQYSIFATNYSRSAA